MTLTQLADEIRKCRDLWDRRSMFRTCGVCGCSFEDLDEIETYLYEGKMPERTIAKRIVEQIR